MGTCGSPHRPDEFLIGHREPSDSDGTKRLAEGSNGDVDVELFTPHVAASNIKSQALS